MHVTSIAHRLRIRLSTWRKETVRLTFYSVVALTDGDVANDRKGGLVRVSLRVVAHSVDADHASGHVSRSSTGGAPTSAAARTAPLLAHRDS